MSDFLSLFFVRFFCPIFCPIFCPTSLSDLFICPIFLFRFSVGFICLIFSPISCSIFLSALFVSIYMSDFLSHFMSDFCAIFLSDLFLSDFFPIFLSDFISDYYPIFYVWFFCPTSTCPIFFIRFFCPIFFRFILSDLLVSDFLSYFFVRFSCPILCPIYFVRRVHVRFFVWYLWVGPTCSWPIFFWFFDPISCPIFARLLSDFLCPICFIRFFCANFFVRLVHVRFFVLFSLSDFLLYFLFDLMSRLFVRFFVLFFWPICCHIFGGDFSSKKIEHVSCIATLVMYCQCVKSFYYYDSIVSRHVWVSSRAIIVLWLLVSYSSSHQWRRTWPWDSKEQPQRKKT